MSIRLMAIVWDSDLPHDEKFVALALADWANDAGGSLYPSQEHIAWKVGKSDRAVRETLGKLHARGVVEVLQRGAGARSSVYRFNARALPRRGPYRKPEESSGSNGQPEETSTDPLDRSGSHDDLTRSNGSPEETSGSASAPGKPEESSGTKKRKSAIRRALELNDEQARLFVEFRDVMSIGFRGRKGSQTQQRRIKSLIRLGAVRADFEYAIEVAKQEPRDDDYAFALGVVARCVEERNNGRDPYERGTAASRGRGRSVRGGRARAGARGQSGDARRDGRGGTPSAVATRPAEAPAVRRAAPID